MSSSSPSNFTSDQSLPKRKRTIVVIALYAIASGVLIFMAYLTLNGGTLPGIGSAQTLIASSNGQENNEETNHIVPLDQIVSEWRCTA